MNLPPALTWLHLLPADASCVVQSGEQWLVDLLAKYRPPAREGDAPAEPFADATTRRGPAPASPCSRSARIRALVATERPWHEFVELGNYDAIVAINCPGVTSAALEKAGYAYVRRLAAVPSLAKARWFVSLDSGRLAASSLSVYTPARASAHLKKAALKLAARLRMNVAFRDQIIIASRTPPPLETKLAELFPGQAIRIGLSAGAPEPAINRKASGAIMSSRGDVIGFLKIAGSEISDRIARREAEVLPALADRAGVANFVPRLLFAGEIDGQYVTVQTPLAGRPAPATWTTAHDRFLTALRSGPIKPASETNLVKTLPERILALKAKHHELNDILSRFMPTLEETRVPSTIVHGDFAPWNLRTHGGQIAAFDWEYAELDGLPLMDQAHFCLQLGSQLHHWDVERARAYLRELASSRPIDLEPEPVTAIVAVYLIDQLTRLFGEGYDPADEMIAWYRRLLGTLDSAQPSPTSQRNAELVA